MDKLYDQQKTIGQKKDVFKTVEMKRVECFNIAIKTNKKKTKYIIEVTIIEGRKREYGKYNNKMTL